MPTSRKQAFFSILPEAEFNQATEQRRLVLFPGHIESTYWRETYPGAKLFVLSATIPARCIIAEVVRKGVVSTPYYGAETRRTLSIYFRATAVATLAGREGLFRFPPTKYGPLTDLGIVDDISRSSSSALPETASSTAEELVPLLIDKQYTFTVAETAEDRAFIESASSYHPFGMGFGQFEFVLRDATGILGAIQVFDITATHKRVHHLARSTLRENYERLYANPLSISRMYGPNDPGGRQRVHNFLLRSLFQIGPYLVGEPLTLIDCASYDYVPAFLDQAFRMEATGEPADAFYYWKPVFVREENLPPVSTRREMTAAYQVVKEKRRLRKNYAAQVNRRYLHLLTHGKFWAIRKSARHNGVWRALHPGNRIAFLEGRRFLHGYGIVSGTEQNKDPSLADFPLRINFARTFMISPVDCSLVVGTRQFEQVAEGGLFEIPVEVGAELEALVREEYRGPYMWVRPNPLLVRATDVERKDDEIFVVMPWGHLRSIYPIISAICAKYNYRTTIATETGGQVVFEDIWRLLNRARAVIVDFTGSRPNVYLEFGMAVVLGKPIIPLTQNPEDCPSDVRQLKWIQYDERTAHLLLETELPKALKDTIAQVEAEASKYSG